MPTTWASDHFCLLWCLPIYGKWPLPDILAVYRRQSGIAILFIVHRDFQILLIFRVWFSPLLARRACRLHDDIRVYPRDFSLWRVTIWNLYTCDLVTCTCPRVMVGVTVCRPAVLFVHVDINTWESCMFVCGGELRSPRYSWCCSVGYRPILPLIFLENYRK